MPYQKWIHSLFKTKWTDQDNENYDYDQQNTDTGAVGGGGGSGGASAPASNFSPPRSTYTDLSPHAKPPAQVSPHSVNKYPVLPDIPYPPDNAASASSSSPSNASLPPDALQKAQKCCKFATSALQYEDIPTAIANLEQCLRILKTGK